MYQHSDDLILHPKYFILITYDLILHSYYLKTLFIYFLPFEQLFPQVHLLSFVSLYALFPVHALLFSASPVPTQ